MPPDRGLPQLIGIEAAAITNVRLIMHDALEVLENQLAPGSLARVNLYFPDPWPKKRHHKRRLIQPDVVRRMLEVLEPGGRLLVKTDHPAYGEVIADVLGAVAGAARLDPDEAFRDLPLTGFERKYLDQGRPIRSFAVLRPSGS